MRVLVNLATEIAAIGIALAREQVQAAQAAAYRRFFEGLLIALTLSAFVVIGVAFVGTGFFLVLAYALGVAPAAFITGGTFLVLSLLAMLVVYWRMAPPN